MAGQLFVVCQGKRHTVKLLPMQPLSALVEQVASKQKPPPLLGQCSLLVDGKVADLSTPLRFANISSSAKLEVLTGQPSNLGVQERMHTSACPLQTSTAEPRIEEVPGLTEPVIAANKFDDRQARGGASGPLGQPKEYQRPHDSKHEETNTTASADAQRPSKSLEPLEPASEQVAHLGLDRATYVFTHEDLETSGSGRREEEYPDEFYDFGLEDYASVVHGYKVAKQRSEAGMKTAKMREQEKLALASRFPHALIRVFLPDGFVLQMRFRTLDSIFHVRQAVGKCLKAELSMGSWYLYVAPPKQVLKDPETTLLSAQLFPAAKLYLGGLESSGPCLRPEVQALRSAVPVEQRVVSNPTQGSGTAAAQDITGPPVASGSKEPAGRSSKRAVPKWFKSQNSST